MKCPVIKYLICIILMTMLMGCISTKLILRTIPSGANVKLYSKNGMIHEGTTDLIDYKIENEDQLFKEFRHGELLYVIEKNGYRPYLGIFNLVRGEENKIEDIIRLDALNTDVELDVDPPGAKATFYDDLNKAKRGRRNSGTVAIPLGDKFSSVNISPNAVYEYPDFMNKYKSYLVIATDSTLILPWKSSYTEETARVDLTKVKAIRIEAIDYLPLVEDFAIKPGNSNTKTYRLKKMNTVLKVLGDIEGIEIEDTIRNSNFGYLGKTPLVRQISYAECIRESESRADDIDATNINKVVMKLRAFKKGYIDEEVNVAVPWGEELTVKVSLKPRINQITFQSDPDGVHVYVERKQKGKRYIQEENKWDDKEIKILKHLGTTPFTYTMDTSDPLEHNDQLVYKKPGYEDDTDDKFAVGVNSYHKVMKPKVTKER
jgi:hypothetical protein